MGLLQKTMLCSIRVLSSSGLQSGARSCCEMPGDQTNLLGLIILGGRMQLFFGIFSRSTQRNFVAKTTLKCSRACVLKIRKRAVLTQMNWRVSTRQKCDWLHKESLTLIILPRPISCMTLGRLGSLCWHSTECFPTRVLL